MLKTFNDGINGIKYYITAEKAMKDQVHGLFELVARIPKEKIRDKFRVEMGFFVFTFSKYRGGYQILAPDFDGNPFSETTEDLTQALLIMVSQVSLLKQYRIDGAPCRFDDKIILTKGALDQPILGFERSAAASAGDSGWFIQGLRQGEDGQFEPVSPEGFEELDELPAEAYESVYAYQLLEKRPAAAQFLFFPRGFFAVMDGEKIREILNENNESLILGPGDPDADCQKTVRV